MAEFTLVIGSKNLSSWSLRAWLAMKAAGAPFDEVVIPLDTAETRARLLAHSRAGQVPVLKHGGAVIWDSIAICEYLAERFPAAGLWPGDDAARARARSVSAEMHAGFADLRRDMPMDVRTRLAGQGATPGALTDIARIREIWLDCRGRFGRGGPFLFGRFGIADAMYAPVVSRFVSYDVALDAECGAYVEAVWDWPAMAEWRAAAEVEPDPSQGG